MKRGYDYDLIVIGAGIAGMVSAVTANSLGKRVAVVEKSRVGGNCTNLTCIPSQALIRLGHVSRDMAHLERLGLLSLPAGLDRSRVMAHIRGIVQKAYEKDLPETAVPDDQLRYIVGCAMQYIMASIPTGESFGIFTKSLSLHGEKGGEEAPVDKDGRIIEILMIYTGHSKSVGRSGPASGISTRQKEGIIYDFVWVGGSWRTTEEVLVAILQLQVTPQLMFGYSYDYPMGSMNNYSKGSHEVVFRYEFGYKVSAASPRYF